MKIITVIGARPQIIKSATLTRAIKNDYASQIDEVVVHTGQHYDKNMSDVFFKDLDVPKPKYNLGVAGLGHSAMTGKMMEGLEEVCFREKPDWVVVYGDTNSTLAGALVASKLNIKLAHIEAGLRSYNMAMPEEVNRILTDRVSNLLFCPTVRAVKNLEAEGFNHFADAKIVNVGDIMYESAIHYSKQGQKPLWLKSINPKNYVLATIHRAETTDNIKNLKSVVYALNKINKYNPVIAPLHPRAQSILKEHNIEVSFQAINPLGYFEMLWLIQNCSLVITDSGGLQKEAYFFEKICLTTRTETEWGELVESGNNILVGYDTNKILSEFNTKKKFVDSGRLFGDSNTSKLILNELITAT